MTRLSVNLNKIALLRNSRGRDFPNVLAFAQQFIDLGVKGITVHPRQDERHIKVQDAYDLGTFLNNFPDIEFNIEGYPSDSFLDMIEKIKPDQCTLVPDAADQLTSDHGFDVKEDAEILIKTAQRLKKMGVRSSAFLDPLPQSVTEIARFGIDRIELYTEKYANSFGKADEKEVLQEYFLTAAAAIEHGLGVNAGHDLDLQNLATFLNIPHVLEVSIGHVLTIECIQMGMHDVIGKYLKICKNSKK